MKKSIFIIPLLLFFSCRNLNLESDLELNVENDTLYTYSNLKKNDTFNIIKYSITNYSDKFYFFNGVSNNFFDGIFFNGKLIRIYLNNKKEVNYINSPDTIKHRPNCTYCPPTKEQEFFIKAYEIDQNNKLKFNDKADFYHKDGVYLTEVIPPKSTLNFEFIVNLSNYGHFEGTRYGFVNLDKNKNYYATFMIPSDSLNYRTALPRYHLKNIEQNNAKVFHGILKADKKIVVKVIE